MAIFSREPPNYCELVLEIVPPRELVAAAAPGITKFLASFWNKLPIVAFAMKSQLEHAVSIGVANFARSFRLAKRPVTLASRPCHQFPNASNGIGFSAGILRSIPFVIVIVTVDHHVRM